MKKERIKNIILTLLVLSSLLLTGKIWLNEKLWPNGYNFFALLETKFTSFFAGDTPEESRNLLFPSHMVAYTVKNSDHASCMLTNTNDHYEAAREFCDASIAVALTQSAKDISVVDDTAWRTSLYTNGIYLDYGANIPIELLCAFNGVSPQADVVNFAKNVRYVSISSEGNLVSNITVFLRDAEGNCFKITTAEPKTALTALLDNLKDEVSPSNRFSFFIGADTATSAMGEVLFAPYLLLTESEPQLPTLRSENAVYPDAQTPLSDERANTLLRSVAMNPKTAKKYTDADGNVIFLQNQSTLKIAPNGRIDYTAAAGQNGFMLSESPNVSPTTQAYNAVNLFFDVHAIFSSQTPPLFISNFETSENGFVLHLDYNLSGSKVITDTNGGHAATLEVTNGCVQKFSLLVRNYSLSDQTITLPSSYTAVDLMFAQIKKNSENTTIENMFVGYLDDGAYAEIRPTWFIKLENEAQFRTSQF